MSLRLRILKRYRAIVLTACYKAYCFTYRSLSCKIAIYRHTNVTTRKNNTCSVLKEKYGKPIIILSVNLAQKNSSDSFADIFFNSSLYTLINARSPITLVSLPFIISRTEIKLGSRIGSLLAEHPKSNTVKDIKTNNIIFLIYFFLSATHQYYTLRITFPAQRQSPYSSIWISSYFSFNEMSLSPPFFLM